MDGQKKGVRRRGDALEEAILQSAWEELSENGYTRLTMESVAARAETNKAVLYRRWDNKSELVIAALHKYLPKITDEIPDTGDLRADITAYLDARVEPFRIIGAETIKGLLMEPQVWRLIITSMPRINEKRSENKITRALTEILKNAERRGEITLAKLSPRIITLPWDLLAYEVIIRMEPISHEHIAEIVDEIILPLVLQRGADD